MNARYLGNDADSLINAITDAVEPSRWDGVGGPCSCAYFPLCRGLVVSATEEMHEDLERFLARLRAVTPILPKLTAEVVAKHEAEVVRRVYLIAADTPARPIPETKELAEVIQSQIVPETWKNAAHTVAPLRGRLLVTAPRSVQRKVAQLLLDLRVAPETSRSAPAPATPVSPAAATP
jgi:hypothetical protein